MNKDLKKLIPENYSIANLYVDIAPKSDKKTLIFYKRDKNTKFWDFGDAIGEIKFETFNMAYRFILENEIEVYNMGSYAKEIRRYEKNISDIGQLTLF